jgi:(p)ppGpp synthase/HD superfamily hydrolase
MMTHWPIDDLQEAWQLATKMHTGQKYGGPNEGEQIEYINHIGSVTFEVLAATMKETDMNADLAIKCALLHDTLEDSALTYDDVAQRFGKTVADGVLALTKSKDIEDKAAKMTDSLSRIKKQPKEVWAVKMADRICNLYAPPFYWSDDKKREYAREAQLIHDQLKDANKYLADRLAQKIVDYERFVSCPAK